MPNLKIARRSAAFEAIKQLHARGELSDNLKPMTSEKIMELHSDLYFDLWKLFEDGIRLFMMI